MVSILALAISVLLLLLLNVTAIEFNEPSDGYEFAVGEPTTITWQPVSSEGTVTIELTYGAAVGSDYGEVIASRVPDSGSYTWTPPDDVADRQNYTICMYPDQPPQNFDCLPTFSIAGAGNSTTPTPSATPPSNSASGDPEPTSSEDSSPGAQSDGLTGAAKAGIGIGAGVGVVVVVFVGFCWMRRHKQARASEPPIPLASYPNSSMAKNEWEASIEMDPHNINELPGLRGHELHSTGVQHYPTELSGNGVRELDGGMMRSDTRPVELPTIEHRFV